ncbi:RNA-directed DNA polymerase [Chromobacterium phragmitis]|uniref:reverse transcriptase family protein n=1 Tax=Chromobacterium phragmitis TaxID=2202141 RepID=UPI000DECFFFD|nr:reverse transcriptase family protein [Chromobacterium phragmitis]AXE29345.1 RNA-directed DNA polymerase [Chromobacterium phragmitis]
MIILRPYKKIPSSIANIDNLCSALDISTTELDEAISLAETDRYQVREIAKKDGSPRRIYNPHYLIRKIQRRINHRIFTDQNFLGWPDYIFGTIPNQKKSDGRIVQRDYISCAKIHCKSKSIASIDIQDFFDNIHIDHVENIFSKFFKYPDEVSEVLANICCLNSHVIQGALTSSYIASLCLFDVEGDAVERLIRKNLRYTRLVDDITISSTVSNYNFDYALSIIRKMLESKDLPINENKTKIQYASTVPLTVHGLRVAFSEPRFPSDEVRRLRAAVKNIETLSQEKNYRTSHAYRHDFNRCMGRVNKLSRIGHKQHAALVKRLQKVMPLPSQKDIERAFMIIERLEKDYSTHNSSYWYSRRYYLAHERLNVLQRTYTRIASDLRSKLRYLRPSYEK